MQQLHIHTFKPTDLDYPFKLRQLDNIPKCLFVQSKLSRKAVSEILSKPAVSVVGTRRMTAYGSFVTQKIVTELCVWGDIPIVSGFMYGIDQAAHRVAIQMERPTIAVLGHGLKCIPRRDLPLYQQIIDAHGIFISEYESHTKAQKWTFVERNRIVAALSEVILVPEAAIQSGSMHTVQFGLDLGKSIAAVSGVITNPYAAGTAYLINQGATLVSSGSDIVALSDQLKNAYCSSTVPRESNGEAKPESNSQHDSIDQSIYKLIAQGGLSAPQIAQALHISLSDTQTRLTLLELAGRVRRVGNDWMLQYQTMSA